MATIDPMEGPEASRHTLASRANPSIPPRLVSVEMCGQHHEWLVVDELFMVSCPVGSIRAWERCWLSS